MPNHIRLFERPLVADEVLPALMVTGVLPDYTAGAAYEGRLPILNSVGKCTVEVLESNLPPGAFVRVDNITKEVVVKWAAYKKEEESVSIVPGGDFEDGDTGSWSLGPGWSIGAGPDYDTKSGTYSARFAGVKAKGSDMVSPRVPAKVNDYIRVSAQVQQGASAKGNAGARVSLIYRNADGAELLRLWGNLVTSGKNGEWNETVAEGAAPAETATVEVVISAYRNRENFALWVDDVVWNHKYTLGQNDDDLYFLRIKVTDSLNRSAYWRGSIQEYADYLTSQLYPYTFSENVIASGNMTHAATGSVPSNLDNALAYSSVQSLTLTPTVVYTTYETGTDEAQAVSSIQGVSLVSTTIFTGYDTEVENTQAATAPVSLTLTVTVLYTDYNSWPVENTLATTAIQGVTLA